MRRKLCFCIVFFFLAVFTSNCKKPVEVSELLGGSKNKVKVQSLNFQTNNGLIPFEEDSLRFFKNISFGTNEHRHAHMMHLDGFHPDIFRQMLAAGRLPHFSFLLSRGKHSFQASTVDKSETMKIILSYLTSHVDVYVSGWWSWARDKKRFENVFIDPVGVLNYNLGIKYPRYPTVFDFLSSKGKTVLSGFALHRRGVPFSNYSRSYTEGLKGVFSHEYFAQAEGVADDFTSLLMSKAKAGKLPSFSNSILAPADEMGHLYGLTHLKYFSPEKLSQHCMDRKRAEGTYYQALFELIDQNRKSYLKGMIEHKKQGRFVRGYLNKVDWTITGKLNSFCIPLPKIQTVKPSRTHPDQWQMQEFYAHPNYVLGMMVVDMQLAKIIHTMRQIKLPSAKERFASKDPGSILDYMSRSTTERSLFENTMFFMLGDHGMVPSNLQTAEATETSHKYGRAAGSIDQSFISQLNQAMKLKSAVAGKVEMNKNTYEGEQIGIDDTNLPEVLKFPQKYPYWQNAGTKAIVAKAYAWASELVSEVKVGLKDGFRADAFWKKLIPTSIIKHEIDKQVDPVKDQLLDIVTTLYLNRSKEYKLAENQFLQGYYDRNVRLIYGGAARNNAELFIPQRAQSGLNWQRRPNFDQIMSYGKRNNSPGFVNQILAMKNVGLIFIRKNNGMIASEKSLPINMEILVLDPFQNQGVIRVKRDAATKKLVYAYSSITAVDPLGYATVRSQYGKFLTYEEWNKVSIDQKLHYHNVPAGMGSYLFSDNPTIGDITVMHATGWNFGANNAGHGGVHRNEKLTTMLVSGPRVARGPLLSIPKFVSGGNGLVPNTRGKTFYPTILDAAPSILSWLGYGDNALDQFAMQGFAQFYAAWNKQQPSDLNRNGSQFLSTMAAENGAPLRLSPSVQEKLRFLVSGYDVAVPPLPNFRIKKAQGSQLNIGR